MPSTKTAPKEQTTDKTEQKVERNPLGKRATEFAAETFQQLDISLAFVTKRKAFAEINFLCVQAIENDVAQKVGSANRRKLLRETDDDRLFDSENAEAFDLLIERLQERRRRFGMQHGARVRIECDHGWNCAGLVCSLDDRAHDQLVTEM